MRACLLFADFSINQAALHAGTHPQNISNHGRTGRGVQRKISRNLHDALTGDPLMLFADAVRDAIVAVVRPDAMSVWRPRP